MEQILGTSVGDFIFVSLILGGGAALLTGQSQAQGWAPARKLIPLVILLAGATRFLHFALFGGTLLSPTGFIIDLVWTGFCAVVAYQATRAAKMVRQYPWLYERAGLFGWRERSPATQ